MKSGVVTQILKTHPADDISVNCARSESPAYLNPVMIRVCGQPIFYVLKSANGLVMSWLIKTTKAWYLHTKPFVVRASCPSQKSKDGTHIRWRLFDVLQDCLKGFSRNKCMTGRCGMNRIPEQELIRIFISIKEIERQEGVLYVC